MMICNKVAIMDKLTQLFPKGNEQNDQPLIAPEMATGLERRTKFLQYLNRSWLILGIVTLVTLPLFPRQRDEFIFLTIMIWPTYLMISLLNMSGRSRLAGIVFTLVVNFSFYGLFMLLVAQLGANQAFETQSTVWMLMGLAVLFAGALVDKWAAPILAACNTFLLIGTRILIAPGSDPRPSVLVFWWMLALTIWLYERTLNQAVARVLSELREHMQADEEIRKQVATMTALSETTRDLVIERDLSELLQTIVERAARLLNVEAGALYLCESELGQVRCVVSYNTPRDFTNTVLKYGEGAAGRVAQTAKPLIINDYSVWEGRAIIYEMELPFSAVLSVPMKWQNEVIGVIHVLEFQREQHFTEDDLHLVTSFANQAAIAVQNARLYSLAQQELAERKAAEAALLESEQRFRGLSEAAFEGILIHDQGIIQDANQIFADLIGYRDPKDLIGKNGLEILPFTPESLERIRRSLGAGSTKPLEITVNRPDGSTYPAETQGRDLTFKGRKLRVVAMRDITERKQAEEKIERQNQRLKALREIDTAILSADSIENIVGVALGHIREVIDCRRASITLIDWETNSAVIVDVKTGNETSIPKGTHVPLVQFQDMIQILVKDQPVLMNDLRALANPSPQLQSFIKDGLHSLCVLPLFSQSNLIGVLSLSSEITGFFDEEQISLGREVANQVAIAITQNRLVEALQQRMREREDLIAELTAKNAELESFTYTVSHDLKSPLVTINGFLGYLEQDSAAGNLDRFRQDAQRIRDAVKKMQNLLNELLELSRIGRVVNESENVSFNELVREALYIVNGRLEQDQVTMSVQPELPDVFVDKPRLIEVLQNLFDNAAKYMGSQPHPHIEVGQHGEDVQLGQPVFYIKDNGIGISPKYQERVFNLFDKLDPKSEGTGVGLALVKRIIQLHGGRIWIESELGQGTTFYFTLPVRDEST